jgi:hypothetical protein
VNNSEGGSEEGEVNGVENDLDVNDADADSNDLISVPEEGKSDGVMSIDRSVSGSPSFDVIWFRIKFELSTNS